MAQQYVLVPADLLKEAGEIIPCNCRRQCSGDCLRARLLIASKPVNVPEHKVGGGFIEAAWNDKEGRYTGEYNATFYLSSDGKVAWAEVCPADQLPLVEPAELRELGFTPAPAPWAKEAA